MTFAYFIGFLSWPGRSSANAEKDRQNTQKAVAPNSIFVM
jgi:hypothetical protein